MQNQQPNSSKREIELDFLRGLAILAVLDFHDAVPVLSYPFRLLGFPPIGWIGVDIFFVLSGFLVGGLLIKEWKFTGHVDSKRFLIRRALKIWPQYYLYIGLVVFTGHRSINFMWSSFVHLQNYFIVIPHLWTLAVEEHAYLLLVLLAVWGSNVHIRARTALVIVAAISMGVVLLRTVCAEYGLPYITQTHTRVEGILYGVMLAMLFQHAPALFDKLRRQRWIWTTITVFSLVFLRFDLHQRWASSFAFDAANLIGISLFLLTYQHRPVRSRSWLYRLVAWIGLYSYGIYLWHVSVYAVVLRAGQYLPQRWQMIWVALADPFFGIAAGVVMTTLVEFPVLKLRDRWFPRNARAFDLPDIGSANGPSSTEVSSARPRGTAASLLTHHEA